MLNPSTPSCLVIGYGNTLRSDDGVGYRVAEQVADWSWDAVRSLPLHQLTPDLAEPIAQANLVIFVDAGSQATTSGSEIVVEPLNAESLETFTGHYADPRSLLALAQSLYESTPIAYRIVIPAICFEFGETISPETQACIPMTLDKIKQLVVFHVVNR